MIADFPFFGIYNGKLILLNTDYQSIIFMANILYSFCYKTNWYDDII